jgi:ABC-type dipeptide/oligopeptide/nickel transport system ATPase component
VTDTPVLDIRNLTVGVPGRDLVRGVDLTLSAGERVGLVGESGSGKSLLSLAVMRLNPPPTRITSGAIHLAGRDHVTASERELRQARGAAVAMIYQDPLTSLNPVRTIGHQIVEAVRAHADVTRAAARRRAVDLLGEVGIPDPAIRIDAYPHEFSGGMRQRVVIAMALAAEPAVLIADEPTTALDVTTQARIIALLDRIVDEHGTAVLFITHDLAVAAGFCRRVEVMRRGRIVESAPTDEVFAHPRHPYTRGLLDALCTLDVDPARPLAVLDDIEEDPR